MNRRSFIKGLVGLAIAASQKIAIPLTRVITYNAIPIEPSYDVDKFTIYFINTAEFLIGNPRACGIITDIGESE